tara:strand:- start:945 stop:1157 length:213 start_codon:yes stop_codon:yes gene_type:complete
LALDSNPIPFDEYPGHYRSVTWNKFHQDELHYFLGSFTVGNTHLGDSIEQESKPVNIIIWWLILTRGRPK